MHIAAQLGEEAVASYLASQRRVRMPVKDRWGHTPASYAEQRGHSALARLLRTVGAAAVVSSDEVMELETFDLELRRKSPSRRRGLAGIDQSVWGTGGSLATELRGLAVSEAAVAGMPAVSGEVQALLDRSADLLTSADGDGRTALHLAAAAGAVGVVKVLVQNLDKNSDRNGSSTDSSMSAGINALDRWGKTPLQDAIKNGHYDTVAVLKPHGGVVVDGERGAQLCRAAAAGDIEALSALQAAGVDLSASDVHRRTPMHLAASEGHVATVRWLLLQGAELAPVDCCGNTPLEDVSRESCHGHENSSAHDAVALALIEMETKLQALDVGGAGSQAGATMHSLRQRGSGMRDRLTQLSHHYGHGSTHVHSEEYAQLEHAESMEARRKRAVAAANDAFHAALSDNNVARARHQLKHAIMELWAAVGMLRNYGITNSTGFVRVLERHDTMREWAAQPAYLGQLERTQFRQCESKTRALKEQAEHVFAVISSPAGITRRRCCSWRSVPATAPTARVTKGSACSLPVSAWA